MKTMKLENGLPIRVKENEVERKLEIGYVYCSRSEWKKNVRDVNVVTKNDVVDITDTTEEVKTKASNKKLTKKR
jgi:hypothetical protein